MDKDFGELIYHSGFSFSGILLLRLSDMNGAQKVEVVKYIFDKFNSQLAGNFCVYYKNRFRIKNKI